MRMRVGTLALLVAFAAFGTSAWSALRGLRVERGMRAELWARNADLVRARAALDRTAAELADALEAIDGVVRLAERVYVRQRMHEQIHALADDAACSHSPR